MAVVVETTVGDLTIDLYIQERPRSCLNFLKLCKVKYYNWCTFHKIERNFIAQTGDPTGTGRGGESVFSMLYGEQAKFFDAETSPRLKHTKLGTVSMVNNGENAHGSQFFITLGQDLDYLDGVHTVFGEVTEGLDVLVKLNDAICDEEYRPYQDILITHTVILDDPFDDPKGLTIPDRSPEPTPELLKSSRISATEDIDDTKGKSLEEIEEEIKTKEAKARATILEMIGDIPDAEVKPPDTVLFVCKLNPVTTAEDLEVIFSRFGKIKSCEVICDKKTGESLQYAFIEYEKPEDCENAYFKMDNVLIDDRRIHVDFSQSVSKLKWKGQETEKPDSGRGKQNYVLKEKAQSKKDDRYQMVFEEDDVPSKSRETENPSGSDKKRTGKESSHKHSKKKHKKRKVSENDGDTDWQKQGKVKKPEEARSGSPELENDTKATTHKGSCSSVSSADSGGVKKKKSRLPAAYRYSNESGRSPRRESGSSGERIHRDRPKEPERPRHRARSRSRSRSREGWHSQGNRKSRTPVDQSYSNRASPLASRSRYEERDQSRTSKPYQSKSPSRSHQSSGARSSRSSRDQRSGRRLRSRSKS